ncbi:MAG: glutathione peroxidase [bacterium]|nr:glutathione peroxidase [Deltaproteobacteria bacterium]MCP4906632.1 glutathione peroxidase [bacterium]
MSNLYDYRVKTIRGDDCALSAFEGKVCLIVNVASACGLTPQYDGLQRLYSEYRDQGFEILAFPCNQFGAQEPGSESEIATYCETNFGVEFPMFCKVEVNGEAREPLFAWLTGVEVGPEGAGDVAWNFTKFLVGRDGGLIARFDPPTEPCAASVKERIGSALG